MTTTGDLRIDDWVVHRPNVVRSVAARVPGIDAEEAASRALEKMVRLVSTGTTIEDPAPYWRRAAVNEAISMTREAGRTRPVEDDTLDGLTPPVAGAELDAERQADVTMLRSALSKLADDDRKILFDRHVHDRAVTDIAGDLGVRPHAVTMRLRRAEERLAGAFAAAHAQAVNEPECRTTRAAMHDYLKGRLLPRRQSRLEVHMDGCTECTRAFIDVREVSWMLRDLGQHLIGGVMITGAVGGAAGAASAAKPRSFGKKETAVAAGVLAALAIGGGAAAMIVNQPDPPIQAVEDAGPAGGGSGAGGEGGGGGGGGAGSSPTSEEPTTEEQPPSIPPTDPQPRPATTPKEDAAPVPADEPPVVADPAPEPEEPPAADSGPDSDPGPAPDGGADNPKPPSVPDPADPENPPTDPGQPEVPEPEVPEPEVPEPEVPEVPETPGLGTALDDLLASLGLSDLPGIDLATTTLDEIWNLIFGTFSGAADDAESATGD
ncbi:sigma-70 family RNA polymerase sigma factor [Promicromonospora sp. AC04]|uniref:zf-HC2 domain-containing protein n=1 Tax=Promicromonospora sp. AC04 TaxID=2135723 RepID=UPI001304BA13|nr:sigma-70 family RNA polymerase sigma factor [Promicromonospora sp. AC04]